jgi:hypothetical protein
MICDIQECKASQLEAGKMEASIDTRGMRISIKYPVITVQ